MKAPLSPETRRRIIALYRQGLSVTALAERFGINRTTIYYILAEEKRQ